MQAKSGSAIGIDEAIDQGSIGLEFATDEMNVYHTREGYDTRPAAETIHAVRELLSNAIDAIDSGMVEDLDHLAMIVWGIRATVLSGPNVPEFDGSVCDGVESNFSNFEIGDVWDSSVRNVLAKLFGSDDLPSIEFDNPLSSNLKEMSQRTFEHYRKFGKPFVERIAKSKRAKRSKAIRDDSSQATKGRKFDVWLFIDGEDTPVMIQRGVSAYVSRLSMKKWDHRKEGGILVCWPSEVPIPESWNASTTADDTE